MLLNGARQLDHEPLVSVLIPCYNHEAYVISSLESVASSDYKAIELIFIDDASKDNSFELARNWIENNKDRFVKAVCIRHENNRGICATGNALYALASGEYINFLASDDHLMPEGLSRQVDFAKRHGVDFVFSDLRLINETGGTIAESALQYYGKNGQKLASSKACLIVDIIFSWSAPWNKSFMSSALIKKVGLFDERLSFEDRDFAIRCLINGSFALMREVTTAYRIRANSRFTPGLEIEDVMSDFRKSDRKNYLNASGLTRLLLCIMIYSYEEKYRELGITNAVFVSRTIREFRRIKGWILKIHQALMC